MTTQNFLFIFLSLYTIQAYGMESAKRALIEAQFNKEKAFFHLESTDSTDAPIQNYRINHYIKNLTNEDKNKHRESLEAIHQSLKEYPKPIWTTEDYILQIEIASLIAKLK